MNGNDSKTSPWVYVAIGCAIPILVIAVLLAATTFWGLRVAKEIREDSPGQREAKVGRVLGCEKIPDGYYAMMSLSIPWVMDLAILSDRPPNFKEKRTAEKPFDRNGFIYVDAIRGRRGASIRDYVEGKADASEILGRGSGVEIGEHEEVGRGSFPLGKATAYYVANRGTLFTNRQSMRGLVTVLYFDCGDRRFRMGLWFGEDPTEGKPAGGREAYAGSHADEAKIREFVSQFSPCGR